MEARSFFEHSPMAEITVSATPEEWRGVINDIIEMEPEDASPVTLKLFELLDGLGLV
jgi:hypothetical protein